MFCPNCGKPEQKSDSYCRQCGRFLPDLDKLAKRETSPEQHLTANTFLNGATAITSLILAILLYATFLNKADTPMLIYIVAGFLTAMFFWNVQTTWRSILLKKQIIKDKKRRETQNDNPQTATESISTNQLLKPADLTSFVPASVTENTTRELVEIQNKSS